MFDRTEKEAEERIDQAISYFQTLEVPEGIPSAVDHPAFRDASELGSGKKLSPLRSFGSLCTSYWPQAVAASVLLLGTVLSFALAPSLNGNGSLLSAVVEAVRQVNSVTYEIVQKIEGQPDKVTRIMLSGAGRYRVEEFPDGDVWIANTKEGRQLQLKRQQKRAIVRSAYASDGITVESGQHSPLEALERLSNYATTTLPNRVIDGKEVRGFLCNDGPYVNIKVWVALDTNLPVRMESSYTDSSGNTVHEVKRGFVFNVPLDDTLFATRVPDGYEADVQLVTVESGDFQIVPEVGVGPLRFGMQESEVGKILGKPNDIAHTPIGRSLTYGAHGLRLEFNDEEGLRVMHCISQLGYGFQAQTFSGATDKGIRIGATAEQIKAAYGNPIREYHSDGARGILSYIAPVVSFHLEEGKVSKIVLVKPRKDEKASDEEGNGANPPNDQ